MPKPLQLAAFFAALGIGLALKCVDYNAEDGKEAKTWDCRKGEKCMVSYNFITKSYESGGCTPDLIDLVCRVENHVLQCGCSPINCDMTDAYKADIRSRKDCWTVSHNNTVRTFYKLHWSCPADDKCLMPFRKASWDDPARERSQDIFWHEESLYQYICGKGCANPQEAYKKADYPLETPTEKPPTTPAATTTTKAVNGSTSASANASSSTPPDAKLTKASSTTMKSTPKKRLKRAATAASTKLSPVYTCDCSAGGGIDCARNFATMMYIHGVSPGRTHQEYVCFYEQRECPRANVIDQQFAGWKTSS